MSSEIIAGGIRRFRDNRVSMIANGNTPVELISSPKTVIHLMPLSPMDGRPADFDQTLAKKITTFYSSHQCGPDERCRLNREGFLFYAAEWYVQVFRDGTIEVVESGLLKTCAEEKLISSPHYEVACLQCLRSHLVAQWSSFFNVNAQPPVAAMVSLLGVSGFAMNTDSFRGLWTPGSNRIDESVVVLPPVVLENSGENLLEKFHPVWDELWRAAGWERSPHYDMEGRWVPDWSCVAV